MSHLWNLDSEIYITSFGRIYVAPVQRFIIDIPRPPKNTTLSQPIQRIMTRVFLEATQPSLDVL